MAASGTHLHQRSQSTRTGIKPGLTRLPLEISQGVKEIAITWGDTGGVRSLKLHHEANVLGFPARRCGYSGHFAYHRQQLGCIHDVSWPQRQS